MKITSRVIVGFAFLIAIFIPTHLYQSYFAYQVRSVNRELTETGFHSGLEALEILSKLKDLDEFSSKFLVLQDSLYLDEVIELRSEIDLHLRTLQRLSLTQKSTREELDQVLELWGHLRPLLDKMANTSVSMNPQDTDLSSELGEIFPELQESVESFLLATEERIETTASRTRRLSNRVVSMSWFALLVAFLLSVTVSFLLYRSISKSLHELTSATGRIAAGDFDVRVDETSRDELGEFAGYLNQMSRRLGELDRIKRDFVSYVSHDLRAPLASIQETTRLLLDKFSENLNETQKRLLELNLSSAGRLSDLISDLLDLTTLQAGVMKFDSETLKVSELVKACVEDHFGLSQDQEVTIDVILPEEDLAIKGDPIRLRQLLGNLLANAISYSPKEGRIEVKATSGQASGRSKGLADTFQEMVQIAVSDKGPGVADEEKEQIFDQFYIGSQGERRRKKNTGLGLVISKKIADAHGSQLWVEDVSTGGARFVFQIPRAS